MAHVIQLANGHTTTVETLPGQCPICRQHIVPSYRHGQQVDGRYRADLEIIFQCANLQCRELFIAYYAIMQGRGMTLQDLRPKEPEPVTFDESVRAISKDFCDIYEEAHKAEMFGLKQICGVGYRKALEFLIKDYLIKKRPDDAASIKAKLLGPCISEYVDDPRVKVVAERATWLGNDETHYERRWGDKDLNDLKRLIDLTSHWIEAEHLTEEAKTSMPHPGKTSKKKDVH